MTAHLPKPSWLSLAQPKAPRQPSWLDETRPRSGAPSSRNPAHSGPRSTSGTGASSASGSNGPASRRDEPPPPSVRTIRIQELETFATDAGSKLARLEAENAQLRAAVGAAHAAIEDFQERFTRDTEPELVNLAMAICARILGQAGAVAREHVVAWAREALAALPFAADAVLAVPPGLEGAFLAAGLGGDSARVLVDPALPPMKCEIRRGASVVEVSLESRIAAVAERLGCAP